MKNDNHNHEGSHPSNIEHIRHSLAHLLATATLSLYPDTLVTIGPAVENGFYYDMDFTTPLTEKDLESLNKRMKEILREWKKAASKSEEKGFVCKKVSGDEAKALFQNNPYKLELIEEIIAKGEEITLYVSGDGSPYPFTDLCRGGHIDDVSQIDENSFKLARIAGAYWRGDEKNKMLTRVYGLAFNTKEELQEYEYMLEEAKKRDHKKLGKELGLFTFSELVGPGLPLWSPKGTRIREALNDYVMELRARYGYQKVSIPHITKKDLYEKSGHWEKYKDDLFKIETRENHLYAMKPMNCPHHTQIFDSEMRSYRDMPQRYCETTAVYRDEQSGELSGLSRILCITQDDAHVFCRVNQINEEVEHVWNIIMEFYSTFGFSNITPRLSRRDPETPEKYLGEAKNWDLAENTLKEVIESHTKEWIDGPGEAAFYGPKIDFMAKDALGRKHQVATIQLDFVQPSRFELFCINEKGEKESVVMLHVAIMGSIERFLSVIIEHFAGAFPLWMSPVQLRIVPIGERQLQFADEVYKKAKALGIRVDLDSSNDSFGKRVRNAKTEKVPVVAVIGDKEMESNQLTLEGRSEKIGVFNVDEALDMILTNSRNKSLHI
ncbi:MAG: threonine--tRNA ligase [Candidatus Taylorbacteria bacterium]|nr:threonine--tRNA ligase [Candidatus Taylorbacteria bacterium]